MASRDDFDDFFGDDEGTPVADTRADGRLYRVPLTRLSPNLVNPRKDFGTEDQLIDFGKSLARRQNQPCPVVSRGAYLKLWPDHADHVSDVDYVLVSGERRYRGANIVGLAVLDCVANDDFATDRKTFMEAVVSENVDRQNFDPIEEAYAVQALVREFGSNRAVAQHFERVDGWVTQRLHLTNLAREVQELVRMKTMPLEAGRTLGKLAKDNDWSNRDQLEWWEVEQERRAQAAAARAAARKAARQKPPAAPPAQPPVEAPRPDPAVQPQPESFTAVKLEQGPQSDSAVEDASPDVPSEGTVASSGAMPAAIAPEQQAETIPEPRQQETGGDADAGQMRRFPYDDPAEAVMFLGLRASTDNLFDMIRGLTVKGLALDPGRMRAIVEEVVGELASPTG